jgi:hypothetical protein
MREYLKKYPWLGWALCLVLLCLTGYLWWDRSRNDSPFSPDRMLEEVTIKYSDTGETVTMPRGRFEKMLRSTGEKIDPSKGLINPKTGQPTGFLFHQAEWETSVKRVNDLIDQQRAKLPENVRKSLNETPKPLPQGPATDEEGNALPDQPAPAAPPKTPK